MAGKSGQPSGGQAPKEQDAFAPRTSGSASLTIQQAGPAAYLLVLFFALVALMLHLWSPLSSRLDRASAPQPEAKEANGLSSRQRERDRGDMNGDVLRWHGTVVLELVLVIGALGGVLYGMIGFCIHLALGDFEMKWVCWYVFRPPLGAGMALALFLATQGGFISYGGSVSYSDIYGTAALALLCGMFSEQVSKKLPEVFATLFRTESDVKRRLKEEPPHDGSPPGGATESRGRPAKR